MYRNQQRGYNAPPLPPPHRGGAVLAAGRAREPGAIGLARAHSVRVMLDASRVRKPGFARP